MSGSASDPLIELADRVAAIAAEEGVATVLIGSMALAVHNYVRGTAGIDLGAAVDPFRELRLLRLRLDAEGIHSDLSLPDANDSLGGMLRVRGPGDEDDGVDIVNFQNPLRLTKNPALETIQTAAPVGGAQALRAPTLAHLIALKLYAGGRRDQADVIELLRRNPGSDRGLIRDVCTRHGFAALLDELVREV